MRRFIDIPNISLPHSARGHLHCDVEPKVRALEQHPVEEVVTCSHPGLLTFRLFQIFQRPEGRPVT